MKFYDAHCHMMNLRHPNLSVMIKRFFKELSLWDKVKISLGTFIFAIPFFGKAIASRFKIDNRVMNLLAIMETELGDCILQMDEDLRNSLNWGGGPLVSGSDGNVHYDKIVLTPLIMDFGLKGYEKADTIYKIRWKPIASQVLDICLGIKHYYKYCDTHPSVASPTAPLFEIYPFMGLDTKNYNMQKNNQDDSIALETLLNRYFNGFENDTVDTRRANLAARDWRSFTGDIASIRPYDFIGIKVYPPLGLNPWPTEPWEINAAVDMDKVHYLYDFCQSHNIPITAHCSENGFLVDKKYKELAHPNKWAMVLAQYPNLRLNLAHFGADNKGWRDAIVQLILNDTYVNVYTDISYRGVDKKYYDELLKFLNNQNSDNRAKLMKRIIFGTDFMINLMSIESYSKYMQYFADTSAFTVAEKEMLCSENAERFLFIK